MMFQEDMRIQKFCYIDCTGTFTSGHNTGIQRVVRNIVSKSEELNGLRGYSFCPVISMGSDLYALPECIHKSYYLTRISNRLLGIGLNLLERIFNLGSNGLSNVPDVIRPQQDSVLAESRILMGQVHSAIVSVCRKALPSILRLPTFLDTVTSGGRKIQLHSGDVFFLADSFWNVNSFNATLKAKEQGARIILLVYDIIPLTHPDFFDQTTRFLFKDYFPRYLKLVDGLISISKFTMNEIARQILFFGVDSRLLQDYAYLGADFYSQPVTGSAGSSSSVGIISESCFLMVGTIEPRKNHVYVVDAFERLWETGSKLKLNIVGRVGWKSDGIMERIKGSKYFNKKLFLYEFLNDADLSALMDRADAVILASTVEGFGLPLIEAMHLNKTVLASDIPVFREIGGEYPIYFPLGDSQSLMEKITLVASGKPVNGNINKGWISWTQSVQILLGKVLDMAEPGK